MLTPFSTKPLLALYVVWHPDFESGKQIADALLRNFRRSLFESVTGGKGLSVLYRYAADPRTSVPQPIDFTETEVAAIVVLLDSNLVADPAWVEYVRDHQKLADQAGLRIRIFPVAIEAQSLTSFATNIQAIQWFKWSTGSLEEGQQKLTSALTYQLCRMLRAYLEHLKQPQTPDSALAKYLENVKVFLSHSKHDSEDGKLGEQVAEKMRKALKSNSELASFFDVYDIPAGTNFEEVIPFEVRRCAVVVIHTNTYSSREWCRREIIEAKRASVPLVVASCISNVDERSFPYMGNVPVVRLEHSKKGRIDFVIARLLDEVMKDFLWRCNVELTGEQDQSVSFLPRPPELISLASLPVQEGLEGRTIVYPDPPLGVEERKLFADVAPKVSLLSFIEYQAGLGTMTQ